MWLCLNKAFLSIVNHPKSTGLLLVRARVAGHIESVFPDAKVDRIPGRDYLYRAAIPRAAVAAALATEAIGINYGNFKNSVKDEELHDRYTKVWREMSRMQIVPPYGSDSASMRASEKARKEGRKPKGRQGRFKLDPDDFRRTNDMLFDTTGAR